MTDQASIPPGALSADEIRTMLAGDPPLVSDLESLDLQVQPNGLDVRLESIWAISSAGRIGREERVIPERHEVAFDEAGWCHLPPGAYVVRLCETVNLPRDLFALGFSRSSLLRTGCAVLNAVWDAGYHGRSEVLLTVLNPAGFDVQRGARIMQLVFFRLAAETEGYQGAYQRENLSRK